jgi:adhesin transport system membrane fusion protein
MLNISKNSIRSGFEGITLSTLEEVEQKKSGKIVRRLLLGTLIMLVIIMFLPWTQNIRSSGQVSTLKPDQRPQTVHSVIGGRIEKWFVQEGDLVKKGDTIAFISEVKDNYFDPLLLDRTANQAELKKQSVGSYDDKVTALDNQIIALADQRNLKMKQGKIKFQQAQLKVTNDSIALQASKLNYSTANEQFLRYKELYDEGLKSLTELENREIKKQNAFSYLISAENKFLASQSELISTKIELSNIQVIYQTEVAKAKSDKFSALSSTHCITYLLLKTVT